jgi:hypothetical protein
MVEVRALVERRTSVAMFETDEEALKLRIEGYPTGATETTGTVRYSAGPDVTLSFRVKSDQSYLSSVLNALGAVGRVPVRVEI